MINIDKLLKKKGWTGAELGKLLVANSMVRFNNVLKSGNEDAQGLVSEKDFQNMRNSLEQTEYNTYNGYISISNWINRSLQMAYAQEQQLQLHLDRLFMTLSNAISAENIYTYIEELPLIMTEKQYKDFTAKRTHEILHPEEKDKDGVGIGFSIFEIIFEVIAYYVALLDANPKAKNPLKPLKKKLEKAPVKDPIILNKYNKVMENGYYTTEDGTRSDSMTPTEWRNYVTPILGNYLKKLELGGKEAELIKHYIVQKRILPDNSCLCCGYLTEEETQRKRYIAEVRKGIIKKFEWHYYEDVPEDLNKWELLKDDNLTEYYDVYRDDITKEEELTLCKAFYNEYKEVVDAILNDIEKNHPDSEIKQPVEEWLTTVYSWQALYDCDFYNFKERNVGDFDIFDGNRRALLNGIAILRPSDSGSCTRIDEKTGYYKTPNIRNVLKSLSLEGLFPEAEDYSSNIQSLEENREVLTASLHFLKGFNLTIDLIASFYDVEEVKLIKFDTETYDEKTKAFNRMIDILYEQIVDTNYEDKELKEKKLKVLKDVFCPIDLAKTEIPEERIATTKENFNGFKAFTKNSLDPVLTLCRYIGEDGKGIEKYV